MQGAKEATAVKTLVWLERGVWVLGPEVGCQPYAHLTGEWDVHRRGNGKHRRQIAITLVARPCISGLLHIVLHRVLHVAVSVTVGLQEARHADSKVVVCRSISTSAGRQTEKAHPISLPYRWPINEQPAGGFSCCKSSR